MHNRHVVMYRTMASKGYASCGPCCMVHNVPWIIGHENYIATLRAMSFLLNVNNGVTLWFCITHIKCKIMSPKLDYNSAGSLSLAHWCGGRMVFGHGVAVGICAHHT